MAVLHKGKQVCLNEIIVQTLPGTKQKLAFAAISI
jgi:hypothetical protein